jgi:hypothetical protein
MPTIVIGRAVAATAHQFANVTVEVDINLRRGKVTSTTSSIADRAALTHPW